MNRDIKQLVKQLTLTEKAELCSGSTFWTTQAVERLGIPSIMMTDGPHGLRKQAGESDHLGLNDSVPSTCFPSAVGLASSWNRDLVQLVGATIGKEAQAENVAILLGPGANIKRSPLCGRNFEYFSEDPYLTGELAAAHITGVQSQGVGTSLKHFAVNNQEHRRMTTDAILDERTLREIYLTGFEKAVKQSQPWTVMSSYNKVNGTYASQHEYLLTTILKEEWGHEGFVVTDWSAVSEIAPSIAAGLGLEMPSSNGEGPKQIVEAVNRGELTEEQLDRAVERLLAVIFKTVDNSRPDTTYDQEQHHQIARKAASETMVLLKNEHQILPLKKQGNIAVIGELADKVRYQGGGSSHIKPTKLDSAFEQMVQLAGSDATITYKSGYNLNSDESAPTLVAEAVESARAADVAVLFIGLPDRYESEGYDREHLDIPVNQQELITAVAAVQPNVVVVLSNGSPIVMPWLNNAKAVLEAYLGGQAAGGAIADLLFGEVNPSGKLAETFPQSLKHNPSSLFFPGDGDRVEYREGIYVGYRYYDGKDIEPLFPFGYGLSYTQFEYSQLNASQTEFKDTDIITVTVNVKNIGQRYGQEVVQLYVHDRQTTVSRPEKELKGFAKVSLEPDEEKTVTFTLDKRSFAYYNIDLKDWHVESGEYDLLIGSSSRQIILQKTVHVESTSPEIIPVYDRNTALGELLSNPKTMAVLGQLQGFAPQGDENAHSDAVSSEMIQASMRYMPLRALIPFTGGALTEELLSQLLAGLNAAVRQ
ncbi:MULTISPECIES: beta-glucosidase family protein [unclassified Paenibacillus]|uniref:beta-glucosidase family protein n=1 Tax=unclassified Paenibacillus TaxID=185978 RepID=UPI0009A79968|nr:MULTISPECIES: glycoside hydrolase family 3 C-terminal domain-containing protein [unclassified Paenibacillus]SLK20942.1 beta-glucosidase [Paenibacillus sp. RU5A]SOC76385.1 beta-glucosidase [Paenibacillus sp. RU26A]SOC77926.1 beta-glucosidase [Paenibacillus sp. RU5M]